MGGSFAKVAAFVLVVIGAFVYVGDLVTRLSGGGGSSATIAGVSPEAGESIFWGKGKCHTCHSIGGKGSAIRCPNLGEGERFPLPIGARAEERARERTQATGRPYTATDYLVECLSEPAAYVVEGYKNEMPLVYEPPIGLQPDEIKAVIAYLQSLGGEVDIAAIQLPEKVLKASAGTAVAQAWAPYIEGDVEAGKFLFFEGDVPCAKCHKVGEEGGDVGPELTHVAGTRTPQFIVESILNPSATIASGYEPYLVITQKGTYISGVKKREDENILELRDNDGGSIVLAKEELREVIPRELSIMPGNMGELLTMADFHNLLAYLMTLE